MGFSFERSTQTERDTRGEPAVLPWDAVSAPDVAFVSLWVTGPDTSIDGVFRIDALRRRSDGAWERYQQFCRPFARGQDSAATARMVREFGVTAEQIEKAPRAAEIWHEFTEFVAGAEVIVATAEAYKSWARHLQRDANTHEVLGLDELARLLTPARSALARIGTPRDAAEVARAMVDIIGRFLELPVDARALAAAGWTAAHERLAESDPTTAAKLARALRLVDVPSRWSSACGELFSSLGDGGLSQDAYTDPREAADFVREQIDAVQPRWATLLEEWREQPTVPVHSDESEPLSPEDLARIDDVFQVILPGGFPRADGSPSYREGQHAVAKQVARTLGTNKLLLVHAPTGTGKTLSYLVPALLWSLRNNVRVAISTYTRALQEQAIDNEVPRALAALSRAGIAQAPRIAVIKGRANYLCWRALRLHVPNEGDGAELWLAWTSLLLFSWLDDDGDLDRYPMRVALTAGSSAPYQRELDQLVRAVRAQVGCCRTKEDRATCGADATRQRAERCHLIITNHAFALVQPTYCKHVIFDECEHLHDQAGNAWSWSVTLREVRDFLVRLRQPGRQQSRAPLDRLERLVLEGDPAYPSFEACRQHWYAALGALDALQVAIDEFKAWREEEKRKRDAKDEHSLLREYVLGVDAKATPNLDPRVLGGARELLAAHGRLASAATELDSGLAQVAATIDTVRARGMARIRRSLELARGDMLEWLEALRNWIPTLDGHPAFAPERFYDVEQDSRGDDLLVARVLLPNEILGRSYYPQLASGVLISATTWLRGGFEVASAYLGLDRAAHPLDFEERPPCVVQTFRAEDPFDYSRVLVCVPSDAPDPSRSREQFQGYVRRFIAHLAERTRGRMLVLFTNSDEARRTGEELSGVFRARGLPLYFQNMSGVRKEELGLLFRERVDSTLLGVDTFWYGADFPGETLEYLVIVKLPYGVPDRYHHAQCAALGTSEQRRRIYLPRALAKLRQGFGRLMRRESDRGCVFILDPRITFGAHKLFLGELPVDSAMGRAEDAEWPRGGSRLVAAPTDVCFHEALSHMNMLADVRRRGLEAEFDATKREAVIPDSDEIEF